MHDERTARRVPPPPPQGAFTDLHPVFFIIVAVLVIAPAVG
jgi:hypothetical protein